MTTQTESLLSVALIATVVILILVLLTLSIPLSNIGKIKTIGLGAYMDSACTQNLTQIDWGTRSPGEVAAVNFYVKNTGNINVTLSFNMTTWNPAAAANFLTVTWNYTGQILRPLDVLPIQITLTVASNITGISTFSYTMTIYAAEKT